MCFGNYGGQTIQDGEWRLLIDYLNALHVDHVVMECAHRPDGELASFREQYTEGTINVTDLLAILADWGNCPIPPALCPADVDNSGVVDVSDLLLSLANWTG